ncbi:MAG: fructosamine kinase family protein [Candidatus Hydrogenedentes bacterium]|nr:fructosamine kinase family protein [Candidatus Hydrogenedentota bacterium]
MDNVLGDRVRDALGEDVRAIDRLPGGCVGEVYRVTLSDGMTLVVKVDRGDDPQLDVEAFMLKYLAGHSALPVPAVRYGEPSLLIMEYLPGDSRFSVASEHHAADLLAELHAVRGEDFGLERDTLIGGLHQPNTQNAAWLSFFREQRLLYMAKEAVREGRMDSATFTRLENFAEKLEDLIDEPEFPSLLHGDVWTTNVLAQGDRITGFIDPAVYYGHPEIELAFITLFDTFGDAFFSRYAEHRPIAPGFFEERRHIYNLYPLLVHVRLFGGGYLSSVEGTLSRFGF